MLPFLLAPPTSPSNPKNEHRVTIWQVMCLGVMMSWPLLSPDRNDTIPRACGSIAVVQKEVREEGVWRERDGDDDHHHHHVARCSYQVKVRFRWRKNAHFSWAKPCSCTALQPLLLLMCREEDKKKAPIKEKSRFTVRGGGAWIGRAAGQRIYNPFFFYKRNQFGSEEQEDLLGISKYEIWMLMLYVC